MLRQRLHYDPNSRDTSDFDDILLHSIDKNDSPVETGCMPPFLLRLFDWLSFWKRKEKSRSKSVCEIDDIV